jgi:hypothetical protein
MVNNRLEDLENSPYRAGLLGDSARTTLKPRSIDHAPKRVKGMSFMTIDDQRIVNTYLDAVTAWNLDDISAGDLIGVDPNRVREWRSEKYEILSEEMVARMMMVAQIKTALEICWSKELASQWMRLPNRSHPYGGLSAIEYVSQHGWPGLYLVLRHLQAWAVGNF